MLHAARARHLTQLGSALGRLALTVAVADGHELAVPHAAAATAARAFVFVTQRRVEILAAGARDGMATSEIPIIANTDNSDK